MTVRRTDDSELRRAEIGAAQRGGGGPAPIGVVYNTAMQRPDAALALAALYVAASRRQARVSAVCVTGAGLDTAVFCDLVGQFYAAGRRNSNSVLPVGLANVQPLPPDAPMVRPPVQRTQPNGEWQYPRGISRLTDTAMADTMMRNGITFTVDATVLLSAPATAMARSLRLPGTLDHFRQRVRRVVVVESPEVESDAPALRAFLDTCPAPLYLVGRDVREALRFPGAQLDALFAWTPANPVADAYRAHQPMPHDEPLHDLAALYYLLHPDADFFAVSQPGTVAVTSTGRMAFSPAADGTVRRVTVDPSRQAEAIEALVVAATSQPTAPQGRGGR